MKTKGFLIFLEWSKGNIGKKSVNDDKLPIKISLLVYQIYNQLAFYIGTVVHSQPGITCSKLTIETLEQGVKYVQS